MPVSQGGRLVGRVAELWGTRLLGWDQKRKCGVCPWNSLAPTPTRRSWHEEAWNPGRCRSKADGAPPRHGVPPPSSSGLPPEAEFVPSPSLVLLWSPDRDGPTKPALPNHLPCGFIAGPESPRGQEPRSLDQCGPAQAPMGGADGHLCPGPAFRRRGWGEAQRFSLWPWHPEPRPGHAAKGGWFSAPRPACLVLDREPGSSGIGPWDPSPELFSICPAEWGLTQHASRNL